MTAPKESVFVVDDDPAVCTALKRLIRSVGIEALTFTSGGTSCVPLDWTFPAAWCWNVRLPDLSGLNLGYLHRTCSIPIPMPVSPLLIRDKNRMRFYEKVIKVKADVAALRIFSPTLRPARRWRGELSRAPFFGVHLDP